jgi:hypothetical protein
MVLTHNLTLPPPKIKPVAMARCRLKPSPKRGLPRGAPSSSRTLAGEQVLNADVDLNLIKT